MFKKCENDFNLPVLQRHILAFLRHRVDILQNTEYVHVYAIMTPSCAPMYTALTIKPLVYIHVFIRSHITSINMSETD